MASVHAVLTNRRSGCNATNLQPAAKALVTPETNGLDKIRRLIVGTTGCIAC